MIRAISRFWLAILVLVAVTIGGFVVLRLHGAFAAHDETRREGSGILNDAPPFKPKRVTYEVFGTTGSDATINYLDLAANPQSVKQVPLPWSVTLTTTSAATSPNLLAQGSGTNISCRITVDGVVKDERSGNGVAAFTFCMVKSA
jgi:hypothetical protein